MRRGSWFVQRAGVLLLAVLAVVVPGTRAAANEPPVPSGVGPGGVTVALLGPGIDYRKPELARRLARDGEGDLIAWDFTDNDNRPFAGAGHGTAAARTLAGLAPAAQLVIAKEQIGDRHALGRMMTFASQTPARIIVWLDAAPSRIDWPILAEAIRRFGDRLFVVPAGDGGQDLDRSAAYRGVSGAANAIIVASDAPASNRGKATVDVTVKGAGGLPITSHEAALMIAALAARALARDPMHSMAGLKELIVRQPPVGVATRDGVLTFEAATTAFAVAKP